MIDVNIFQVLVEDPDLADSADTKATINGADSDVDDGMSSFYFVKKGKNRVPFLSLISIKRKGYICRILLFPRGFGTKLLEANYRTSTVLSFQGHLKIYVH